MIFLKGCGEIMNCKKGSNFPTFQLSNKKSIYSRFFKRPMDIVLSLIALIVLSPIMLMIAILVKINLGSPVIFKQQRPGKDGKIFVLYKFRTMCDAVDADGKRLTDEERLKMLREGGETAVSTDTQRLTKLGSMLRTFSLDELPELVNILKGEMSIVGPRPLSTIYLSYYNEMENHRHDVLPGLTGLAQVNGRNAISWEKRFEYDLEYVNNISFKRDLYIVWRTVAVVFERSNIARREKRPEAFHVVRQREWDKQKAKDKQVIT